MSNIPDGVESFDFRIETPQGTYTPFTDGHAVGFAFDQDDEPTQFIYLNPSSDSDDGQPNVFVYMGDKGDPSLDGSVHFYDIGKAVTE